MSGFPLTWPAILEGNEWKIPSLPSLIGGGQFFSLILVVAGIGNQDLLQDACTGTLLSEQLAKQSGTPSMRCRSLRPDRSRASLNRLALQVRIPWPSANFDRHIYNQPPFPNV